MELDDFAKSLSSLVQCSRVDNRKYGNTIAQNIQYQNKVDNFKYGDSNFTINEPDFEKTVAPSNPEVGVTKSDISRAALKRYFGELYLDDKLDNATFWIKEILSTQLFSATP